MTEKFNRIGEILNEAGTPPVEDNRRMEGLQSQLVSRLCGTYTSRYWSQLIPSITARGAINQDIAKLYIVPAREAINQFMSDGDKSEFQKYRLVHSYTVCNSHRWRQEQLREGFDKPRSKQQILGGCWWTWKASSKSHEKMTNNLSSGLSNLYDQWIESSGWIIYSRLCYTNMQRYLYAASSTEKFAVSEVVKICSDRI
jgi:hypothetical protein